MLNREDLISLIIRRAIILGLIIIGIMFISVTSPKPYILGFIFGITINILGFKLIERTVEKAVRMQPQKAFNYTVIHYFVRYLIYAVVLIIAATANYLNFLAVVLGLFMIKIVIIISALKGNGGKDKKGI